MQFYTDDHRQVRILSKDSQPNGFIPKANDPVMMRLIGQPIKTRKKRRITDLKLKA